MGEVLFNWEVTISLPTLLEFDADFPTSSRDDDPPGKRLAQFLVASLGALGLHATKPELHSTYGWAFCATHENVTVWCMLQLSDNWILTVKPTMFFFHWLLRRRPRDQIKSIHEQIEGILRDDERVDGIRRYTKKEAELRYSQDEGR